MTLSILLILSLLSAIGCSWTSFDTLHWLWIMPVSFLGTFVVLVALVAATVCLLSVPVNINKPQERDSKLYRFVIAVAIDLLIPLLGVRLHTQGLEMTPKSGRVMVVCNHLYDIDPGVLLHCFRKSQLAFIAKREVANLPVVCKYLHKTMGQFVNRENDREALRTILNCIKLIKEDQVSIGVFPEGYCSPDGKLHPFRHGVFKIAQKTNVPIVVCTLRNTKQVLPNFKHFKSTHVHMHLVGVLQPEDYQGLSTVELGNKVHAMMAADLGPDLVLQTEE